MNFVKVRQVIIHSVLGEPCHVERNVWIDVFQIYMVTESINGFVRIELKPNGQGKSLSYIDVTQDSLTALEAAFKRFELPY